MMKQKIFVFLLFGFCLNGLFANVTAYSYGKGGMIYPVKSTHLFMESEKIDIDVYGGSVDNKERQSFDNYYYLKITTGHWI